MMEPGKEWDPGVGKVPQYDQAMERVGSRDREGSTV